MVFLNGPDFHCHSLSLAPVNPDWFYRNGSAFLVLTYPGCPGKKAVKLTLIGKGGTFGKIDSCWNIGTLYNIIC